MVSYTTLSYTQTHKWAKQPHTQNKIKTRNRKYTGQYGVLCDWWVYTLWWLCNKPGTSPIPLWVTAGAEHLVSPLACTDQAQPLTSPQSTGAGSNCPSAQSLIPQPTQPPDHLTLLWLVKTLIVTFPFKECLKKIFFPSDFYTSHSERHMHDSAQQVCLSKTRGWLCRISHFPVGMWCLWSTPEGLEDTTDVLGKYQMYSIRGVMD